MVDAVQAHVPSTSYAAGLASTLSAADDKEIAEAVQAAKAADIVVLALGTDLSSAHEEMDAKNITIPAVIHSPFTYWGFL